MSCDNVPTTAEIEQAKKDVNDFNTFMTSTSDTFVDSNCVSRLTLTGAVNKFGFGIADFTFTEGGTLSNRKLLVSNDPIDGLLYRYVGAGTGSIVVTAGTDPTTGMDWEAFTATAAEFVSNANGGSVQDFIDSFKKIKIVDSISELRLLQYPHDVVIATGYYQAMDGAFDSHHFLWNPNSIEQDNEGTVIKLNAIEIGRYELQYDEPADVKWYGGSCDGITDDADFLQKAIDNNNVIRIPKKIHLGKSVNTKNKTLIGFGVDVSVITSSSSDYILYTNYADKFRLDSFKIIGDITKPYQIGLYQDLDTNTYWTSRSHRIGVLTIENCGFDGIHLSNGCELTDFQGVRVTGSGRDGMHIDAITTTDCPIEYLNFLKCKVNYNGRYNFYFKYIKKHVSIDFCDLSSSGSRTGEPIPVASIYEMIPAIYVEDSPFGLGNGTTFNLSITNNYAENATILARIRSSTLNGGAGELLDLTVERNTIYPKSWAHDGTGDTYGMCLLDCKYLNGLVSEQNNPRAGYHYVGRVDNYGGKLNTENETFLNVKDDFFWLRTNGTFTPTITGSSGAGAGTYTTQFGKYTRSGNIITVEVKVSWTAHAGGSGNARISGFPFNFSGHAGSFYVPAYISGFELGANRNYMLDTFGGTKNATLFYQDSATGVVSGGNIPASGSVHVSFSYFIN